MEFYTLKEVAQYLRVHTRTILRWLEKGELQGYKLGIGKTSLWRISKTEVEQFLKRTVEKSDAK